MSSPKHSDTPLVLAEMEESLLDRRTRGHPASWGDIDVLFSELIKTTVRAERAEASQRKLREGLAAYRSAFRSGEPETAQLRNLGDAALSAGEQP